MGSAGNSLPCKESTMLTTIGGIQGEHKCVGDRRAEPIRWSHTVGIIIVLALSILVASLAASAQPRKNIPLIGVLRPGYPPSPDNPSDGLNAFRQGLRDLGYVEGQTILLEVRFAEYQGDRLAA